MAKEKVTLKLNVYALRVVNSFVELNLEHLKSQGNLDRQTAKLLSVILGGLLKKKLAPAMVFPKEEVSLSLNQEQAIAFYIVTNQWEFTEFDPYTGAVLMQILNEIEPIAT